MWLCRRHSLLLVQKSKSTDNVLKVNNDFWEQLSLFSLISWDYIQVKGCVVRTQPLPKGHVPLVTVLTANLLLILTVRR